MPMVNGYEVNTTSTCQGFCLEKIELEKRFTKGKFLILSLKDLYGLKVLAIEINSKVEQAFDCSKDKSPF